MAKCFVCGFDNSSEASTCQGCGSNLWKGSARSSSFPGSEPEGDIFPSQGGSPEFNVVRVGFWMRLLAVVIDILAFSLIIAIVFAFYNGLGDFDLEFAEEGVLVAVVLQILFWQAWQATPGKMLIGAIIVDSRTLKKPTFWQFIGRYFAMGVTGFFFGIGYLLVFGKEKRGLHDLLANTMVIRKSRPKLW